MARLFLAWLAALFLAGRVAAQVSYVRAGHLVDMVAVKGDPLANIRLLEAPPAVMKGGALVR